MSTPVHLSQRTLKEPCEGSAGPKPRYNKEGYIMKYIRHAINSATYV